jgi:hypothetical protein
LELVNILAALPLKVSQQLKALLVFLFAPVAADLHPSAVARDKELHALYALPAANQT